jgi:hypothetical protein
VLALAVPLLGDLRNGDVVTTGAAGGMLCRLALTGSAAGAPGRT